MTQTIIRSYETVVAKTGGWNAKTLVQLSESRSLLIHTLKSHHGVATYISGVTPTEAGFRVDHLHDFKKVIGTPPEIKATEKMVSELQGMVLGQIDSIKDEAIAYYQRQESKAGK